MSTATATTTAVAVVEKQRASLRKEMTPKTRELVDEFIDRFEVVEKAGVLAQWDLGKAIGTALANERDYGVGAVKQIAAYLDLSEQLIYNLRNFAKSFPDRKYVAEQMTRRLGGGRRHLELSHWIQLAQIEDPKERVAMVDDTIKRALTVNDLIRALNAGAAKKTHARQGGRKPKIPSSPMQALQKLAEVSQKLNNLETGMTRSVFDRLDEIDADSVDDKLLNKLEETRGVAAQTHAKSELFVTRLDSNIERVERMLKAKEEAAELDEAEETTDKDTARKAKASSNGKAKKKKGRPVAA